MTETLDVATITSVNPATGDTVGAWTIDDAAAVAAAVDRARAATAAWQGLGFGRRRRALLRWASHLIHHAGELAELIHRENGKPVDDAYLEVGLVVGHLNWAARHAERALASEKVFPGLMFAANHSAVIDYRPFGVVGVIGPWNYPIYTPNGSIAYALAAGNTVVFKPSEYTVAVGHAYVDAFTAANPDLPAGIITVVNGYGDTGAALVESGVDKIAFTGSTRTGKRIMAAAAARLTPVLLECGGKDAAIVADDADVAAAAESIAWSGASNSGQTCVGTERVYVVESVYERFLTELTAILSTIEPGPDRHAAYGPMTMPGQVEVVAEHIDDALTRGAKAVVGGRDSVRAPYISPVVLTDVPEDSLAVTEETFGPTLTVRRVRDVDEAVALANNSHYGLASVVFSRHRGLEIARRLKAGSTSVNAPLAYAGVAALPFGGVEESGIGRIHGVAGLREFARSHSIAVQRFPLPGMALTTFARTASTMAITKTISTFLYGRAK